MGVDLAENEKTERDLGSGKRHAAHDRAGHKANDIGLKQHTRASLAAR